MLAGEIMLLLFLAQWLHSQYLVQERRLHQDIKSAFTRTEQKLTDSLLNRTIAIVLDAKDPRHPKGKLAVSTSFTFETPINQDSLAIAIDNSMPLPGIATHKITGNDTIGIRIKRTHFKPHTINGPMPEEVQKVLRMAIMQTANDKNLYTMGFSSAADSGSFFKAFEKELVKKGKFGARWDTLNRDTGAAFHYRSSSYATPVAVSGYRPYLLRSIWPQFAFSVVLLLLIGLAFGLAYRMMKQQARFNRQKDSFISNISHELKTPVATTKVAIEALTTYKGIDNPERTRKYLHVAAWEMDRLSNMIDRIMNIIQAEHGNIIVERAPVNLVTMTRELVETQQPILDEKRITVAWGQLDDNAVVAADKIHLQGVLYNLLDNAVKYGGNQIHISIVRRGPYVQLSVKDNGPGIRPEYHKKVFENFFRIPSGNRHDVKGHGLGLSYAREVVHAHQGTLSLESKPGEGATFIISLPLNPAA
jgi:signal transduction histidine kinase